MTASWVIRSARNADLDAVLALLHAADLPSDGVGEHWPAAYAVAEQAGRIVGAAAMEAHGEYGLLRSVVVADSLRGSGVGDALVRERLADAAARGLGDVFLLTTTAARWFPRYGFVPVTRAEVPAAVRASVEFASACPASAAVMVRRSA